MRARAQASKESVHLHGIYCTRAPEQQTHDDTRHQWRPTLPGAGNQNGMSPCAYIYTLVQQHYIWAHRKSFLLVSAKDMRYTPTRTYTYVHSHIATYYCTRHAVQYVYRACTLLPRLSNAPLSLVPLSLLTCMNCTSYIVHALGSVFSVYIFSIRR